MSAFAFVAALLAPDAAAGVDPRHVGGVRCDPGFIRMALPESLARRSRNDPRSPREDEPVRRVDCHRLVNA